MKHGFYYFISQRNLRTYHCLLRKYFIYIKKSQESNINLCKGLITFHHRPFFSVLVKSRATYCLPQPVFTDFLSGYRCFLSLEERKQKEVSVVMELKKEMKSSNWTIFQVMYKQMGVSTINCTCTLKNRSELNHRLGSHQHQMGDETRD